MSMGTRAVKALVLLGPPGSGKGTLCRRLSSEFPNLKLISTGDLLRNHVASDGSATDKLQISAGKLVDDALVTKLVRKSIISDTHVILDGFPRSLIQAQSLENTKLQKDSSDAVSVCAAVSLDVPMEKIMSRFANRWIHLASGRTYGLDYNPPRIPGHDDVTGDPLVRRSDDESIQVVRNRLNTHYESTLPPLARFYQSRGLFYSISGSSSNEIYPKLADIVMNKLLP